MAVKKAAKKPLVKKGTPAPSKPAKDPRWLPLPKPRRARVPIYKGDRQGPQPQAPAVQAKATTTTGLTHQQYRDDILDQLEKGHVSQGYGGDPAQLKGHLAGIFNRVMGASESVMTPEQYHKQALNMLGKVTAFKTVDGEQVSASWADLLKIGSAPAATKVAPESALALGQYLEQALRQRGKAP